MNNSCEKQHIKDDSYIHVQNRTCLSKINQKKPHINLGETNEITIFKP